MAVFNLRKLRCHLGLHKLHLKNNSILSRLLLEGDTTAKLWLHSYLLSTPPNTLNFHGDLKLSDTKFPNKRLYFSPSWLLLLPHLLCPGTCYVCIWVNTGIFLMMKISVLSKLAPSIAEEHTLFPSPALWSVQYWGFSLLSLLFLFFLPGDF